MLSILVLVATAAVVWRFGYWPFDRSYRMLPRYSECCQQKATLRPRP